MAAKNLPKYDNPPVIEVVFGVQFNKIAKMQAPHTGLFWEKLDKKEFPELDIRPPINHAIERFDGMEVQNTIQTFGTLPLPRILYLNKINNNLIQLQEDRFLRNWRKTETEDSYSSYEELFPQFTKSLEFFEDFVKNNELGEIIYDQYELTYVNHIPFQLIGNDLTKIENIYPDFKCTTNFLSEPEGLEWRKVHRLPNELGRLYISTKSIKKLNEDGYFILDLTVRGFKQRSELKEWFDLAHEWIVRAFEEITAEKIQKEEWKKKI